MLKCESRVSYFFSLTVTLDPKVQRGPLFFPISLNIFSTQMTARCEPPNQGVFGENYPQRKGDEKRCVRVLEKIGFWRVKNNGSAQKVRIAKSKRRWVDADVCSHWVSRDIHTSESGQPCIAWGSPWSGLGSEVHFFLWKKFKTFSARSD